MARSKWLCPKCRALNLRTSSRKCLTCGGLTKPKRRVPKHAETLRDHSHAHYAEVNELIHGAGDTCGVCRKPPTDTRNLDRDHDHVTGLPRGLACPGNQGCNSLMPRQMTLGRARAIVAYLERVEAHYAGLDKPTPRPVDYNLGYPPLSRPDERSLHQLTERELRARVNLFTEDDPQ